MGAILIKVSTNIKSSALSINKSNIKYTDKAVSVKEKEVLERHTDEKYMYT